jgi:hypothetical protein
MATRDLIRRVSLWGNNRWMRRVAVLLWIGMLGFDPWMVSRLVKSYAVLAMLPNLLLPTLTQLGITWLAFRGMRIGLAQPTLEDSAAMQYGSEFDALTEKECEELYERRFRDFILGRACKDEREAELRLQAEGAAYRLLRPALVIAVAGYWAVCLLGPFEPIRETLTITAIAFTWFAVAVLVLPTMVRMWTQPNEIGELRIVSPEKVAQQC